MLKDAGAGCGESLSAAGRGGGVCQPLRVHGSGYNLKKGFQILVEFRRPFCRESYIILLIVCAGVTASNCMRPRHAWVGHCPRASALPRHQLAGMHAMYGRGPWSGPPGGIHGTTLLDV